MLKSGLLRLRPFYHRHPARLPVRAPTQVDGDISSRVTVVDVTPCVNPTLPLCSRTVIRCRPETLTLGNCFPGVHIMRYRVRTVPC